MPVGGYMSGIFGSSPVKPLQDHTAKVLASGTGLPISTTHTLVGGVLAIIFFFTLEGIFS